MNFKWLSGTAYVNIDVLCIRMFSRTKDSHWHLGGTYPVLKSQGLSKYET